MRSGWLAMRAAADFRGARGRCDYVGRELLCAARAPTGLERGGDRSAGPAGARAARGAERAALNQ